MKVWQKRGEDERIYQSWRSRCDRAFVEPLVATPAVPSLQCSSLLCHHQPLRKKLPNSLLRILSSSDTFKRDIRTKNEDGIRTDNTLSIEIQGSERWQRRCSSSFQTSSRNSCRGTDALDSAMAKRGGGHGSHPAQHYATSVIRQMTSLTSVYDVALCSFTVQSARRHYPYPAANRFGLCAPYFPVIVTHQP